MSAECERGGAWEKTGPANVAKMLLPSAGAGGEPIPRYVAPRILTDLGMSRVDATT